MSTTHNHDNAISPEAHAKLLAELEGFEHLLFEPKLDRATRRQPRGDRALRCAGRLHWRGDRGCRRGEGVSGAGCQRAGSRLRGDAVRRDALHRPGVRDRPAGGLFLRAPVAIHHPLLPNPDGKGGRGVELAHGYDREVIYALVKLRVAQEFVTQVREASAFAAASQEQIATIRAQLDALAASGKRVAIWGGTGKAAAFMHYYGVDAEPFPLVVDSDQDKVGTHVPGCGQRIVYRDALKEQPADVVIVPMQWRARDVLAEMAREGIAVGQVLIEHDGRLVDYADGEHPYR